jgi:hypothetical protein
MIPTISQVRSRVLIELDKKDQITIITLYIHEGPITMESKVKLNPDFTWEWYDD